MPKKSTIDESVELADIDDSQDEEIQKKLNEAKVKYPVWNPTKKGQTLQIFIKEVRVFANLHGNNKHGCLISGQSKNEKYPMVSVWLPTVLISQSKKFIQKKAWGEPVNPELLEAGLSELKERLFAIRYEGEEKSSTTKMMYENYTMVEI